MTYTHFGLNVYVRVCNVESKYVESKYVESKYVEYMYNDVHALLDSTYTLSITT